MKIYLRILRYARPYRVKIAGYALTTIFYVIFSSLAFYMITPMLEMLFDPGKHTAAQGVSVQGIFDPSVLRARAESLIAMVSTNYGKSAALLTATLIVVLLNLGGNVFKFLSSRSLGTIRTRIVEDIRRGTYGHLLQLSVGRLENERKGDLMGRLTSDLIEVENSVVVTFESLIRDPLNIIFVLVLMFRESWQLTLFIFAVLPFSVVLIGRITKALKRDATDTQNLVGHINSVADETISGIRIIKAFHAEKYMQKVFDSFNSRHSRITRRQWHKKALVPIFSESAMVLVVAMVMWYGGNLIYQGKGLTAPAFITYIGMFYLISRPAKSLSQSFGNIYKGLASAERIFGLMDMPVTIKDSQEAIELTAFNDKVEIKGLSFSYVTEPVLQNINLTIEKGKVYALVGPSGSGKSTLAELLLRFYDPTRGEILIDGYPLQNISQKSLRELTAVVTQEAILFNDTIYNNISFGMPHVTEDQVIQAARAANAHEFIMETEQGYHTNIGDRGGLLSGGQRQRLSIARAILKNPAILVLDEATSALDTSSEKVVQDALYRLMEHRTSIVIAHRLSTIQDADEILVMEKGRVIERGTHRDLIARNGLYTTLYQLQQLENAAEV